MKRIKGIKTYCFSTDKFIRTRRGDYPLNVVITEDKDTFEATMYCAELCVHYFMFGVPKEDRTFDDFINLVEGNLDDYIPLHEREQDYVESAYEFQYGYRI